MAVCDGYSKKAPIEINTSTAATDYQLFLNITYDSDMQADFDDLCFANEEENTELDYFLGDKSDSNWASVWLEVDSIDTSNGTQAYVYYGKAGATTSSSYIDVFGEYSVSIYPFQGNANDLSGKYNGTVTDAVLAADRQGDTNSAYYFDGDADYIQFQDSTNEYFASTSSARTYAWIMYPESEITGRSVLRDRSDTGIIDFGWGDSVWTGRFYNATTNYKIIDVDSSVSLNQWQHVAVEYDGNNGSIYVNGTFVDSILVSTLSAPSPSSLRIGAQETGICGFLGKIDEFRVYNKTLDSADIARFYMASEPDYGVGTEENTDTAPTINLHKPQNQTYYNSSVPYDVSTDDPEGDNYDCNVSYDGSVIDTLSEADESATGTIASTDGYHNLSVYCLDTTGSASEETVYFSVYAGFNISVTYGNGTAATNWNISVTNGTSNYTDTNISNPEMLRWDDLPSGEINITIDDGSDSLYYFQNITNYTNNNTNFETLNLTLYEKEYNTVTLSASPGWSVYTGTSETISCSSSEGTPSITLQSVGVSNPYSFTVQTGTYSAVCSVDETDSFRPTNESENLLVNPLSSCTSDTIFAFSSTFSVSNDITTFNLTSIAAQNYIRSDMGDVYTSDSNQSWINTTAGHYFVVNTTGLSSVTLEFGNYFVNTEYAQHERANVVEVTTYNQNNTHILITLLDEINGTENFPPNATLINYISCSQGQNYISMPENDTSVLLALLDTPDKISVRVQYTADSYYSRTRYPDEQDAYALNFYTLDAYSYALDQVEFLMEDPEYYNTLFQIYKTIGGETIIYTEGYFDISHSRVEFLMEDADYWLQAKESDGTITSLGVISVVEPTTKSIYPSEKNLLPSQTYVSENLIFEGYFDNSSANFTTLYLTYEDLSNQSANVTITVYNSTGQYYQKNYTNSAAFILGIANTSTNDTYFTEFEVHHPQFGNSPIDGSVVVTKVQEFFDLNVSSGWYSLAAMFIIFLASIALLSSKNGIAGTFAFISIGAIMIMIGWISISATQATLLLLVILLGVALAHKSEGQI